MTRAIVKVINTTVRMLSVSSSVESDNLVRGNLEFGLFYVLQNGVVKILAE